MIKELSEENIKRDEKLYEYELENEKLGKTLFYRNAQQEEGSRLTGRLTIQLDEREAHCERLQVELVSLIHDL